jgi:hypothetical protein
MTAFFYNFKYPIKQPKHKPASLPDVFPKAFLPKYFYNCSTASSPSLIQVYHKMRMKMTWNINLIRYIARPEDRSLFNLFTVI